MLKIQQQYQPSCLVNLQWTEKNENVDIDTSRDRRTDKDEQ